MSLSRRPDPIPSLIIHRFFRVLRNAQYLPPASEHTSERHFGRCRLAAIYGGVSIIRDRVPRFLRIGSHAVPGSRHLPCSSDDRPKRLRFYPPRLASPELAAFGHDPGERTASACASHDQSRRGKRVRGSTHRTERSQAASTKKEPHPVKDEAQREAQAPRRDWRTFTSLQVNWQVFFSRYPPYAHLFSGLLLNTGPPFSRHESPKALRRAVIK